MYGIGRAELYSLCKYGSCNHKKISWLIINCSRLTFTIYFEKWPNVILRTY